MCKSNNQQANIDLSKLVEYYRQEETEAEATEDSKQSRTLEIVSYKEGDKEVFGVFGDIGPAGAVYDIWVQDEDFPAVWKNSNGVVSIRRLLLTTTLRYLGFSLESNVGERFEYKKSK